MTTTFLALDLSLTGTGHAACWLDTDEPNPMCGTIKPGKLTGYPRMRHIVRHIDAILTDWRPALVCIEGLYVGQRNNTLPLAELHGVVKYLLGSRHTPHVLIAPQTRAVYATGSGNAGKDEVLAAVVRRYDSAHVRPDIANNNEADALAMACHHYGAPLAPVPASHARALKVPAWPDLPDTPTTLPADERSDPAGGRGTQPEIIP
jgi:crossover junction endodeoxyribonuclease RuvC